jgi:hypothetical protein
MGLGRDDIQIVARLRTEGHFAGERSIVELGAQQLANSLLANAAAIESVRHAFGAPARSFSTPLPSSRPNGNTAGLNPQAPFARELWEWLGFRYSSIDVDKSPGAIALDLNFDDAPENMRGAISLVTNCGTTEHVANQLNAFKVVHDLCAIGGVMLHHVPAQGFVTHGLVNYNPKFFWMLARSNGYKWLYWDFRISDVQYRLNNDVIAELRKFHPDAEARAETYRVADGALFVVMQKLYDMDFVPPLDVPTGAEVDNPALAERYWTVLQPKRFADFIRMGGRRSQIAPSRKLRKVAGAVYRRGAAFIRGLSRR